MPSRKSSVVPSRPSLGSFYQEKLMELGRASSAAESPSTPQRPLADLPLMEFIPKVSPLYLPPLHLKPLIDLLERILAGESLKLVVHTPPRHGKTETLLHFAVLAMLRHPRWTIAYGTYAEDLAFEKSRLTRDLADAAKLELRSRGVSEWRTPAGGGFLPRGIGGGLTGRGLRIGIVDDPVKDRLQAESSTYRQRAEDWFRSVFYTRREPGASIIVNMARWHDDDLAGRILKGKLGSGWIHVDLPAITDDGETLWPQRWTREEYEDIRETLGAYEWEALYQGRPRPRGGTVFGEPFGYAQLPTTGFSTAIGLDLSYTENTSSDYSVLVVMLAFQGYYYVLDVVRAQVRAPVFKETVLAYHRRFPTARIRMYAAGTELGSLDFFMGRNIDTVTGRPEPGVPINVYPPRGDKFTRAIPYAAAWNAQRVLVPQDSENKPWVNPFLAEHAVFTGVDDKHDDQVDAAGSAYDQLAAGGPSYDGIPDPPVRTDGSSGRRM